MLEKVRDAVHSFLLILGTGFDEHQDRYRRVIFHRDRNDSQAVGQSMFLKFHLGSLSLNFSKINGITECRGDGKLSRLNQPISSNLRGSPLITFAGSIKTRNSKETQCVSMPF